MKENGERMDESFVLAGCRKESFRLKPSGTVAKRKTKEDLEMYSGPRVEANGKELEQNE